MKMQLCVSKSEFLKYGNLLIPRMFKIPWLISKISSEDKDIQIQRRD